MDEADEWETRVVRWLVSQSLHNHHLYSNSVQSTGTEVQEKSVDTERMEKVKKSWTQQSQQVSEQNTIVTRYK